MNNFVICSPLHYVLDKEAGSEFIWAYKIYEGISRAFGKKVFFVCGGSSKIQNDNLIDCNIFSAKKINLSLNNILKFYTCTFLQTIRLKRIYGSRFFLHHLLPFSIGNSFNLFAIVFGCPLLIGPIQSPLTVWDSDIDYRNLRGRNRSRIKLGNLIDLLIKNLIKPLLNVLSALTLKRATKIVAINKHTMELLVKKGIDKNRIIVIPPGVDTDLFVPKKNSVIRTRSKINLLSVGYLLKRKGVDLLIEAMVKLKKTHNDIFLTIVGDGPQRIALEKQVADVGLVDCIKFVGVVPNTEIHSFYRKADIFVSMSRAESWGQMYLEAMACKLPVISSKNVGSRSIISDGKDGFLIEQENPHELANKITYLIKHPDLITKMGSSARKKIVDTYDWDQAVIPKYIKLYQSLLASL